MNSSVPPSKLCISLSKHIVPEIISKNTIIKHNFFELRLDLLTCKDLEKLNNTSGYFIITCRGAKFCSRKINLAITLFKEKIFAIDICADCNYKGKLKDLAKKNTFKTILSYHDYEKTPTFDSLISILEKIENENTDFYKIVTKTHNSKDAERIINLYDITKDRNKLIAFGMGDYAKQTRIEAIKRGAPFIFVGYSQHTTAPGQPSFDEMLKYL
jgi:3-dehydroquinate dehydratase-1